MQEMCIGFTIFTKPWPEMPLEELAELVANLGFDGVELPVRPGFQVTPESKTVTLPKAARIFGDLNLRISSVAGDLDEATITACGEARVPILRTMARIDLQVGYRASEESLWRRFDALLPVLEACNVKLGVQNHCGEWVGSAIGLMHLIDHYDPARVGAVLDFAHCALAGEPEAMAVDIVWPHLCLVNFKNAFWRRQVGPESEDVIWREYWTTGSQGIASWPKAADELARRGYRGDVCLTAEYTDPLNGGERKGESVIPLIAQDFAFAKRAFGQAERRRIDGEETT